MNNDSDPNNSKPNVFVSINAIIEFLDSLLNVSIIDVVVVVVISTVSTFICFKSKLTTLAAPSSTLISIF